jgi:hypothetical protein
MRAIPRLPAVTATRAPGANPRLASTTASASRALAVTSAIAGTSSVSRTSRAAMVSIRRQDLSDGREGPSPDGF